MVTVRVRWDRSFRVVAAHLPRIDIFERVSAPADVDAVRAVEALTNPRLRDVSGTAPLIVTRDRAEGPGSTFVMAPFAYRRPGRFSDGTFGVYHAARERRTAIAESAYHRAAFLRDTDEPPGAFEHRVIEARVAGRFVDAARDDDAASILSPNDYSSSQVFGRRVHDADGDGIVWPSVRHSGGRCVAVFRPRLVSGAHTSQYLGFRWDGTSIVDVFTMASLVQEYPADPGTA